MRNENGFGSIVCLDKTGKKRRKPWAVRITTGWKNGKQQRKYLGYYTTQKEALIALAEYHNSGINLDVTKLTLLEVGNQWWKRTETRVSESAMKTHKMAFDRLGKLGDKPIREVKGVHLQDWMDSIELKPGSKNKIKSTMMQIFDYAMENDIVDKNYAKFIKIDTDTEEEAFGKIFTTSEIEKLWKHSDNIMVQDVLILIYSGMRIGEYIELDVSKINLEEGYAIGGNKTAAGKNRVIPFHRAVMPFVQDRVERGYMMDNGRGGRITYSGAKPRFKHCMEELNMEHRYHDTRKTATSLIHSAGVPMETVRMIIGHSGKGVTEKVYLRKEPHELVEAINQVAVPNFVGCE